MTKPMVATIGYQGSTVPEFLDKLTGAGVDTLVDVRAVAASRRPGFSKTSLRAGLEGVGIGYVHLRGLGTPADGRAAARAGRTGEMHEIFHAHMKTLAAEEAMYELQELLTSGRHVALLCFEADYHECHRLLVAEALAARVQIAVKHL